MCPLTTHDPAKGVETNRGTRPDKLAGAEDWDFKDFSSYFHDQLELMLSMDESLEWIEKYLESLQDVWMRFWNEAKEAQEVDPVKIGEIRRVQNVINDIHSAIDSIVRRAGKLPRD